MLMVLLQWLCSKVWGSEFSPRNSNGCHHICSLVYIQAPKDRVHCSLWLRISDNPVCTSHVTHKHTHIWTNDSPSCVPSIILMIYGGRYNSWSYSLCSFLQFPITFSPKSLGIYQRCCQTQCTVFLQWHKPSVTPTAIKILHKHTHVYTIITSFLKAGRKAKHYEAAPWISTNSFPLNFFTPHSYCLMTLQ